MSQVARFLAWNQQSPTNAEVDQCPQASLRPVAHLARLVHRRFTVASSGPFVKWRTAFSHELFPSQTIGTNLCVMSDPDREDVMARAELLQARTRELQKTLDARRIGGVRWGRLALTAGALAAVAGLLYLLTGSWLWSILGVLVGVPLLMAAGAFAYAFIAHRRDLAAKAEEVALGAVIVTLHPTQKAVSLAINLPDAALAVWLVHYLEYCVSRYNSTNWSPDAFGEGLLARTKAWLETGFPNDALGGWSATSSRSDSLKVPTTLARRKKGYVLAVTETVGETERGEHITQSFLAIASAVLEMDKLPKATLVELLTQTVGELSALGNKRIQRGDAANGVLSRHPAFAKL